MLIEYNVEYQRRVGMGPKWERKTTTIALDDIPEWEDDWRVDDMAKAEARRILHNPAYPDNYIIDEITRI